jgi:hypothetical protein
VDDIVRSGRLLLIAALATASAACGREAGLVGVSAPRTDEPPERARDVDAAVEPSPVPPDFRTHMTRMTEHFASKGHGELFEAVVWANDLARPAIEDSDDARDGAVFVEELLGDAGPDASGLLVMEKHDGAWRSIAVGADGDVAGEDRLAACTACHREAPRDFVFPLPARLPPQTPTAMRQSSNTASSAPITAIAPSTVATAAATYDASSAGSAALPSRR